MLDFPPLPAPCPGLSGRTVLMDLGTYRRIRAEHVAVAEVPGHGANTTRADPTRTAPGLVADASQTDPCDRDLLSASRALIRAALGAATFASCSAELYRALGHAVGDSDHCGAPPGYRGAVAWLLEPARIRLHLQFALQPLTTELAAAVTPELRRARVHAHRDPIGFAASATGALAAWFGDLEQGAMAPHPQLARHLRKVAAAAGVDGVAAAACPSDPLHRLIRGQSSALAALAAWLRVGPRLAPAAQAGALAEIARVEAAVAAMLVRQGVQPAAQLVRLQPAAPPRPVDDAWEPACARLPLVRFRALGDASFAGARAISTARRPAPIPP